MEGKWTHTITIDVEEHNKIIEQQWSELNERLLEDPIYMFEDDFYRFVAGRYEKIELIKPDKILNID